MSQSPPPITMEEMLDAKDWAKHLELKSETNSFYYTAPEVYPRTRADFIRCYSDLKNWCVKHNNTEFNSIVDEIIKLCDKGIKYNETH